MGDKVLLGIPFHNMYSFDSSGRPEASSFEGEGIGSFTKQMVALGWHCRLVECAVSCETGWNCKGLSRARIGQDMTDRGDFQENGYSGSAEIQIPERFQALAGATTLSRSEMRFLIDTNGELDFDKTVPTHIVWPFRGVKWAVSRAYFAKRLLGESQSCDKSGRLWGNAGQFRIFYYRRAALLCEMEPCDRTDLRSLDPDFYDLWNSL